MVAAAAMTDAFVLAEKLRALGLRVLVIVFA
jgi:hypothetical protein